MKTIYKYSLSAGRFSEVSMPSGAQILAVQTQRDEPQLWALVETDNSTVFRTFGVYGTGHELPKNPGKYIGTVQNSSQTFVFHVFEVGA